MDDRHDRSRLVDAIAETRAAFAAALRCGDAKAASAVYANGASLLAPSAELIRGRKAIERFWAAGVGAGLSDVELDSLQLERQDGFAYEVGRYALRLDADDGGIVLDRGKYVLVHERQQDGSWQWAVEMFNPDVPPARAGGERKERC
jgi:ketosteroid isomerase-like protein